MSSVVGLLERIYRSHTLHEANIHLRRLKSKCLFLLLLMLILCFFKCHVHIYNAWMGPFHLNLDQFIKHWKIYSGVIDTERSILTYLFPFDKEYLQIELGENHIDHDPNNMYFVYFRHPIYNQLLYKFHPVTDIRTANLSMELFVKLPNYLKSHFHKRLSYQFQRFNSDTLQCILRQFNILSVIDTATTTRSNAVKIIEEIYDKNATEFNKKVIAQCGILIGYLYTWQYELVFNSLNERYRLSDSVTVFDASSSYTPYMSHLFITLPTLWILISSFICCYNYIQIRLSKFKLLYFTEVHKSLRINNIASVEHLDYLLMSTPGENKYNNRLFIVQEKYLIIVKIDLNEHRTHILDQFHQVSPFIIIDIQTITNISKHFISITQYNYLENIPYPIDSSRDVNDELTWLHEHLMYYSERYRYSYEQEQLRQRQEAIRIQEEQQRHRLSLLVAEEERLQTQNQLSNFEHIWDRVTSASPYFIANFRLEQPRIVREDLLEIDCPICLETLHFGERYVRWPCPAQHVFHYDCMLNVLRRQNSCPLCRHLVEAAPLIPIGVLLANFMRNQALHVVT